MTDEINMLSQTASSSLIAHGCIACFGAVVHAARAYRNGHTKNLLDFLTLAVMSSFSGVIFALLALYMMGPDQQYLTLAAAGTGGFLGVEGMTLVVERIKTLISGTKNER